jgi:outer membrane protein assembly factor BamB
MTAFIGCGSGHHLADYPFTSRTLAVVYIAPPQPELLTASYSLNKDESVVNAVIRTGSGLAREREARRASARLDSATSKVDIPAVLAQRTLERASRYLGTRPVTDAALADYILEVQMTRFGINARDENAAYLFTFAETVLLDRRTGREIWNIKVHGRDRLTPFVSGSSVIPGSVVTAATLGSVSVANFQEALNQLAESSSTLVTNELRAALRDARND